MIVYDRLWDTMAKKHFSQYRLIRHYGISTGQLGRLRKNEYVSTHTIEVLCNILDCHVEDIMEFIKDDSYNSNILPDASSKKSILDQISKQDLTDES